jgi:cellobiose phosphorylase
LWFGCRLERLLGFRPAGRIGILAFQLSYAMKEYIEISEMLAKKRKPPGRKQLMILNKNIEKYAWDGQWYLLPIATTD